MRFFLLAFALLVSSVCDSRAATFTVANTNDVGGGSLRQAIINANASGGSDVIDFNIPTTDPGYSVATGVFSITPSGALPPFTDSGTVLDATTQTTNVGNTNTAAIGAGATVGVDALFTTPILDPEVEIVGVSGGAVGLDIRASNTTIRGLAIWGFSTHLIQVGGVGGPYSNTVIEQNVVGTTANSFSVPTTVAQYGVRIDSASSAQIRDNLVGFLQNSPVHLASSSSSCTVTRNEIRRGDLGGTNWDGILIWGAPSTVEGNLIDDNRAVGVDTISSAGGHTISNNTITANGQAGNQTAGVRLVGTGSTVERNIIQNNIGPGVLVVSGSPAATQHRIRENQFGGNGGNAIDLVASGGSNNSGDGVSLNDGLNPGTSGNTGLDYPVITAAVPSAGMTVISGTACSSCIVEVYESAPGTGDDLGGPATYGEGIRYLGNTTATAGGNFSFTTPIVGGGNVVSALAVDGTDNTSEFAENFTVDVLSIVKGAYQSDGTPLPNGSTVPTELLVVFMLYISNQGGATADISLQDLLDPGFLYESGTMKFDNSVAACAAAACTVAEEAAIFAAASAGTALTDGTGDDVASFASATIDIGNQDAANSQLDIAAGKTLAVVFTVRIQ